MRKQPSTAVPLKIPHVLAGVPGVLGDGIGAFERSFAAMNGSTHAVAVGNGTTALYVALLAMKERAPDRDEVVLPAYTVPTLTLAFNRAGLKTVLCDVDRETFNMDPRSMAEVVTGRTLAVIPVHMFGFPCTMRETIALAEERGFFVLEDACQAPGARLDGKRVGSIGDAGIFSFCKGKNISTFHGGMVTTDDDGLAESIRGHVASLPPRSFTYRAGTPVLLGAFSFAMRPWFYGAFYSAIANFKSTEVHEKFHPTVYNRFMAGVGNAVLPNLDRWNAARAKRGRTIISGLEGAAGVTAPREIEESEPVYNHVPLVFDDPSHVERAEKLLFDRGIDTGRMYERSINHIYDWLDYPDDPEPFPDAAYIAPRLLTLPSPPVAASRCCSSKPRRRRPENRSKRSARPSNRNWFAGASPATSNGPA